LEKVGAQLQIGVLLRRILVRVGDNDSDGLLCLPSSCAVQ